jgi:amino acid transporter
MKKNNPWISGLFYLFATVIIMAGLATIAKVLSVWILPLLILGGLLLLTVIGAFQLRNDNQIEEKNFLALMKLAFKQIPLLGKLLPKKESE